MTWSFCGVPMFLSVWRPWNSLCMCYPAAVDFLLGHLGLAVGRLLPPVRLRHQARRHDRVGYLQPARTDDEIVGSAAGMAGVFAAQPLDFAKVRLQAATSAGRRGVVKCLYQAARAEGGWRHRWSASRRGSVREGRAKTPILPARCSPPSFRYSGSGTRSDVV